jgi:hypothetical protein
VLNRFPDQRLVDLGLEDRVGELDASDHLVREVLDL